LDKQGIPYKYSNDGLQYIRIDSKNVLISITHRLHLLYYNFRCIKVYKNGIDLKEIHVYDLDKQEAKNLFDDIDKAYTDKSKWDNDLETKKIKVKKFIDENTVRFETYCNIHKHNMFSPSFTLQTKYENIKELTDDLNIFLSHNEGYGYEFHINKDIFFFNSSISMIEIDPSSNIEVVVQKIDTKEKIDKYKIGINDYRRTT